jgi:uncharacterized protein
MYMQRQNQPWYKDGLRFECQRCGGCCRGEPGMVWIDKNEIKKASSFLAITQDVFARLYLRIVNGSISLLEHNNGDCIMYEDGCKIYSARPSQCRTFPFWKSNLENKAEWAKQKNTCPGIGKGRLHTLDDIGNYLKPNLSNL